jgi:sterol desaturase/sphingolipid hydroxylase (fatty acid hydroxylase superfamily)
MRLFEDIMSLLTLEHGKLAYRADFLLYASALPALTAFLIWIAPRSDWLGALLWAIAGLVSWTLIEYTLHRFVLHGLQPFRGWHEAHHDRPRALICSPTIFSASLIAVLVFLPAWVLGDLSRACSITLGLLVGYLAYATIHHGTHHWRAKNSWFKARKRWHAMHHHSHDLDCYGVTSSFWDHVFATAPRRRTSRGPSIALERQ